MNSQRMVSARPILALLLVMLLPLLSQAQIGGKPGAFSRMGFGARGMGMGNAMSAVSSGDIVSYYNPALVPFVEQRQVSAAYGALTLDRHLNFLSFSTSVPPGAGLTFGVINAGVSDIDGRDSDGKPTGALKTSENMFFLGFGNRFSPRLSLGLNIKLFYYHLYTDISSTSVGLDLGMLFKATEQLTLAAAVHDIGSKYKWDTSKLYGQQNGATTQDRFPLYYVIGGAYRLPESLGTLSAELEMSNASTMTTRVGLEMPLSPQITVRSGIDRIDLKEKGNGVRPSFGFTAQKEMDSWTPSLNYAFVLEPFTNGGMHVISLSLLF